ncbi:MAG: nuclear transport factor 2 family protein [Thermoleophilaceae bacterium]
MADERVQLVRKAFELYLAGDAEEWIGMLHPDIELEVDQSVITSGSFRGREEFAHWAAQWDEMWEDLSYEPEEFFEAPAALVVGVRQRAQGAGSGVPVDQVVWWVFEFEGEQVRRALFYAEKEAALEAAGISDSG